MADAAGAPKRREGGFARYARESRDLGTSFLFALPLLLVYEVGIVATGSDVVNGASALLRAMIGVIAPAGWGLAAFNACVVAGVFAALLSTWERGKHAWRPGLYAGMAAESVLYAGLLLVLLGQVPRLARLAACVCLADAPAPRALPGGLVGGLVLSLGAGVYEEIFFRLGMLGGGRWLLRSGFGVADGKASSAACVVSAVIFSLFHHVGSLGDTFHPLLFLIRVVAGVFLGVVYLHRGLGIAIGAHALYDVLVTLVHYARTLPG